MLKLEGRIIMSGSVKLVDKMTGSVLFECSIQDIDKAYVQAEEYEQMGLDIELKAPSMPETLVRSLGGSDESINELNKALDDEIASHIEEDLGCSVCLPEQESKAD
ncbi:MAG: hypothetical protein BM556_04605 [Bacteriovorax sp. MedPE-SWde]|nr:MAG: hypothetical protein BM556_04605 [Bacteriovorax sp. MedPE-SWde]